MPEHGLNGEDLDVAEEGESEGFDLEQVRELGGFVLRATRRRPKLALTTFVVIAAAGVTIAAAMPRTYSAEVKLLTQEGSVLRTLSNSKTGADSGDNPKNVAPMIMRRDNLISLVKETHLVERFDETRPPLLRLKDRMFAKLFGSPSADDRQLQMALTLESKIAVTVGPEDSIVDITVDWANPQIAYDLVTLVEKNFLEARYDSEVAAINESIAILDEHAKNELAIVDAELEDYQKVVAARVVVPAGAAVPGIAPAMRAYLSYGRSGPRAGAAATTFIVDPEVTRALEEKRLRIRALEDEQQRTVDALRQQLLQAQLTLTPMHPTVITLQQRVAAMSEPSPELSQLRAEEHALMAQIVPPRAPAPVEAPGGSLPGLRPTAAAADGGTEPAPLTVAQPGQPDGQLQLAQSKLEAAIRTYQEAANRSDAARVELDITRAAYKHRYTVYTPPEVPRKPKKATAQLVGVGSVLGALLLAFLLAAAADIGTGRVLEPWQIRRRLKLDILGELDNPS